MSTNKKQKDACDNPDKNVELALILSRLKSNEREVVLEALQILQDHIDELPDDILDQIVEILSSPSCHSEIIEETIYLLAAIISERDDLKRQLFDNISLISLMFSYFDSSSIYVQIAIGNLIDDISASQEFKSIIEDPRLITLIAPAKVLVNKLGAGFDGNVITSIHIIQNCLNECNSNIKKLFIFHNIIDSLITLIKNQFPGSLRNSALDLLISFMKDDKEIIDTVTENLEDFYIIFDDLEHNKLTKDDNFDSFVEFLSLIDPAKLSYKAFEEHIIKALWLRGCPENIMKLIMKLDNKNNVITHLIFSVKIGETIQFNQDATIVASNSLILALFEKHYNLAFLSFLIDNNFASLIMMVSVREDLVKIRESILNNMNNDNLALFCLICSNIPSFIDPLKNLYEKIADRCENENVFISLLILTSISGFPMELFSMSREGLTGTRDVVYETILVNLGMSGKSGAFKPLEEYLIRTEQSEIVKNKIASIRSAAKPVVERATVDDTCTKCDALNKKLKRLEKKANRVDELEKKNVMLESYVRKLVELLEDNYIEFPELEE